MELLLVRHGSTEWSLQGKHTGRTDLPLTAEGEDAALGLRNVVAAYLGGRNVASLYSSAAIRARFTAKLVFPDLPVRQTDLVREFDYGEYEGRRRVEIQQDVPDWQIWTHGCPGGESVADVGDRADAFLAEIPADQTVAVVSHGHFCRVLTARALGLDAACGRLFASMTSSLSVIKDHHGQRSIYVWNATAAGTPLPDGTLAGGRS